jgi:hypothetical protein
MVNQQRLQELYEKGRQSGFKLPKSVTVKKEYSYEGYLIHIFRHNLLGDLGRIVIIPNSNTKTNIHCEIAGDPDDPMTKRRQKIFEPIAREITEAMDEILGKSDEAVDEYNIQNEGCLIPSKVFPCPKCNEVTAMMLFDDNATTQSELEDHVRLMYSKVKELNVPTWVVGKEIEIESPDGIKYGKAISMKVWPNREEVKYRDSNEFNYMIDTYMNSHCSKIINI